MGSPTWATPRGAPMSTDPMILREFGTFLYHGVLAPHAKWRSQVVLKSDEEVKAETAPGDKRAKAPGPEADPTSKVAQAIRARRLPWADLLRRVFSVDVLKCDKCDGNRTIISAITQPDVIRAILSCLGLATEAKRNHPARGPPQSELCFP